MSFEPLRKQPKTTPDRKRCLVCIATATVSALTQASLLGIFTALVVVNLAATRLRVPTLSAIVLNAVVTLVMLAVIAGAVQPARRMKTALLEPMLLALYACISVATAILSIYILAKAWSLLRVNGSGSSRSSTTSLMISGLVVWSVNAITQVATYALLAPSWPWTCMCLRKDPEEITTIGYRYPGNDTRKRFSLTFRSHALPVTSEKAAAVHSHSPSSASVRSAKSSRHASLSQVFGPLGSKTRLIVSQSLHGRDSETHLARREPSLEIACRGETPEPVGAASGHVYELSSSPPLVKHPSPLSRLEPIPGSRPVSPAKPLDGPFPAHDAQPDGSSLPEYHLLERAQSPASARSASSANDLPFPPMIGEVAFQSHIHPLFRSGSPGPHPLASPGTVVTASPQARQLVSPDMISPLRRQRSGHSIRAGTPDVPPAYEAIPLPRVLGSASNSRATTPELFTADQCVGLRKQRSEQSSRVVSPALSRGDSLMQSHRQASANHSRNISPELPSPLDGAENVPNFSRPGISNRNDIHTTTMI